MCDIYVPCCYKSLQYIRSGLVLPEPYQVEVVPGRHGPFLANAQPLRWQRGTFGLAPQSAVGEQVVCRHRVMCDSVIAMQAFRHAWENHQFALIPCDAIYDLQDSTDAMVGRRIERIDGRPFAVAGIWEKRNTVDGVEWSYAMLAIRVTHCSLMNNSDKPNQERERVAVLDPADYDAWLGAKSEADVRALLKPLEAKEFAVFEDGV